MARRRAKVLAAAGLMARPPAKDSVAAVEGPVVRRVEKGVSGPIAASGTPAMVRQGRRHVRMVHPAHRRTTVQPTQFDLSLAPGPV